MTSTKMTSVSDRPRSHDEGRPGHLTYADYLTWPDSRNDDLIDGIACVREPPAPAVLHQEIVGELYRQVATTLKGKPCRAYVAPVDVRLPKGAEEDNQIDTVVQPDVFIVCNRQKIDARGIRHAPDWIVEVLSPSTVSYDRRVKLPVYERAGVREVWLVDPLERTVTLHQLEAGRYGSATVLELKGQTQLTAVPGVTIDWEQVLASIS